MCSVKELRTYAEEHLDWARTARTDQERDIFLKMAQAWLELLHGLRVCHHYPVRHRPRHHRSTWRAQETEERDCYRTSYPQVISLRYLRPCKFPASNAHCVPAVYSSPSPRRSWAPSTKSSATISSCRPAAKSSAPATTARKSTRSIPAGRSASKRCPTAAARF
jgi:hypothetical protein